MQEVMRGIRRNHFDFHLPEKGVACGLHFLCNGTKHFDGFKCALSFTPESVIELLSYLGKPSIEQINLLMKKFTQQFPPPLAFMK